MRLCVAGHWHQASVLSACLAGLGHQVIGVGDDPAVMDSLSKGTPPVHEPVLPAVLRRNIAAGRLRYTTDYIEALADAEIVFLAIDTPVDERDVPLLESVLETARRIGEARSRGLLLVVTAQVPLGTCECIEAMLNAQHRTGSVEVAYVPEFLRLGTAIKLFRRPDRVVIGARSEGAADRISQIYRPLGRPIFVTSIRTAEMAKHASNAFLATSISFANEIADLCEAHRADALAVAGILRADRRIGKHSFLTPGLGFQGGTLGREVRTLQALGKSAGRATPLMDVVMQVNDGRTQRVMERLERLCGNLRDKQVGVWGLTYKAGTSTMRRSSALTLVQGLTERGAAVKAYDILADPREVPEMPGFTRCTQAYDAAAGSDALMLLTPWDGVRAVDLDKVKSAMRQPVFLDVCNLFDPSAMRSKGFTYAGVGR